MVGVAVVLLLLLSLVVLGGAVSNNVIVLPPEARVSVGMGTKELVDDVFCPCMEV